MRQSAGARRRWLSKISASRAATIYVILGWGWISVSDWLFERLVATAPPWWAQSMKAAAFVIVTGALLYVVLARLQEVNRRTVALLAESEAAYRRMFADNPNPMFVYHDETLQFLAVNDAAIACYGWRRNEFLKLTLWDIRPPGARAELETALAAQRARPEMAHSALIQHWKRNGEVMIMEVSSHRLDFRGSPARLILAQDVTQRVKAERELEQSRQQLHEAQRIAAIGSWTQDVSSGEINWSPEILTLLGADETLTYERSLQQVLPEDRAALIAAGLQLQDAGRFHAEYRLRRGDGAVRYMVSQGERVDGPNGPRMFGTLQDVTERKLAEQALADSERKYRQLVELMPDGLLIHDGQQVVFANAAMAQLLGSQRPEQLVGEPLRRFVAGARYEHDLMGAGSRRGLDNVFQPSLLRRIDGEPVEVEVALQRVRLERSDCVQAVVRDLRAQNRMQAALARANERLSRLSTQVIETGEQERRHIARELHDEVGQLLTFTQMTASWLQRHVTDEEQRARADTLVGAVQEALAKVRDLALLLRPRQLDTAGLRAAIEAHLARYLADMNIGWQVAAETLEPRPDATVEIALFRIFQEAVTNAIKHSGASRLDVSLRSLGDQLQLVIRDDGQGFDRDQALQSSFSLGLLTMAERAHLLGGDLNIASGPDGTEIRAVVPYRVTPLPAPAQQERISG